MLFMKKYLLAFMLLFACAVDVSAQRLACVATPSAQPFSLVSTLAVGIWLRLNTATGQLYQIQNQSYSTQAPPQRAVNATVLSDGGVPGRFALFPDGNAFTASSGSDVLLDQQTGQAWLVAPDKNWNYTFTPFPGA